jgi:hypothetical protein
LLIQRIECPIKRFFPYRLQFSRHSLLDRCNSLESRPFHCKFFLWNKKSQPALNQGSRVDGITQESVISPKTRWQSPKTAPVHRRTEDIRAHFPETKA